MKKIVNKIKINASRLLCMFMIMTMVVCMAGCGESKNDDDKVVSDVTADNQVNSYVPGNVTEGVLAKVDFVLLNVGKISIDFNHDFSVESIEAKDDGGFASYMCDMMLKEQEYSDLYANNVEVIAGGGQSVFSNPGVYKRAIMPWIMPLLNQGTTNLKATKLIIDITITDGAKFDDKFLDENPDPVAGISDAIIGAWMDMAEFCGLINSPYAGTYTAVVNGDERVILGDASAVAGNNSGSGSSSSVAGNAKVDITGTPGAVRARLKEAILDEESFFILCEILESNCTDIKTGDTILVYEGGGSCFNGVACDNNSELQKIMGMNVGDELCLVVDRHKCEYKTEDVYPGWMGQYGITNIHYWACMKVLSTEGGSATAQGNGSGNSSADITGVADAVRIKIYHNFCDGAATEIMAEVLESNCADIKVGETIAFYENGSGSDKDCLEMECGSLSGLYFLGEDAVCSVVVKRHNCKMANETVHPVWNVTNPIYWAVSRVL